ncbi:unnamed protein product [Phytomonas sp. EM1]|nr:unnamed protein product [Phytomonas sp. EM1]|eukprot:CCW59556.1 unnamed protein product [Phytomonas sp. isolate EM1]
MKRNVSVDTDREVVFDGNTLLSEQMELLLNATPAEIRDIYYLKLKLNAKKKSTVQQNQLQRIAQLWDGEELGLQPAGGGVPFTRSISTHFPPGLTGISRSPHQHSAPPVLSTDGGSFSLARSENPRPPVRLSLQSAVAAGEGGRGGHLGLP